mmetsp:Transcript_60663/g.72011  ORF Transcript_60663/g.72011 Transcript_60663/m.72011 type:complete len:116 (+) Transcript_60663:83-430(+)
MDVRGCVRDGSRSLHPPRPRAFIDRTQSIALQSSHGRFAPHRVLFLWRHVEEIALVELRQRDIGGHGLVDGGGSGASSSSSGKGQLAEVVLSSSSSLSISIEAYAAIWNSWWNRM